MTVLLGCAAGSTVPSSPSTTGGPAVAASAATTQAPERSTPTTVPNAPTADPGVGAAPDYEAPVPVCPAPPLAVEAPAVMVGIVGGATMPASMGSSSVLTCSTAASVDVAELRYPAPLIASPDDRLTFRVDRGWRILWFEEVDFPKVGEGMNMTPGVRLTDPPVEVTIPVPRRGGDMIVRLSMWVIRADGRAVAQIGPEIWVSAH